MYKPQSYIPLPGVILVFIFMVSTGSVVHAHDARPLFLNIKQQSPDLYNSTLAVPSSVEADNLPVIHWPGNCNSIRHSASSTGTAYRTGEFIRCTGGLDGRTIGINYPVYNPSLSTVMRLVSDDGLTKVAVLSPEKSKWKIPDRPTWWSVALDYLQLGIQHILGGIDHLLFVTGLLILARSLRRVIVVITGFTVAHSITLTLAALKLINLPVAPIEAAIALSILFLAAEIARGRENSLAFRYPLLVSSTFGLLHGLGFASALKAVGLPTVEIPNALLCFNLGVEVGQIAFILCLMGIYRLISLVRLDPITSWPRFRTTAGYVLGIPATFWFFQRLAQF